MIPQLRCETKREVVRCTGQHAHTTGHWQALKHQARTVHIDVCVLWRDTECEALNAEPEILRLARHRIAKQFSCEHRI